MRCLLHSIDNHYALRIFITVYIVTLILLQNSAEKCHCSQLKDCGEMPPKLCEAVNLQQHTPGHVLVVSDILLWL